MSAGGSFKRKCNFKIALSISDEQNIIEFEREHKTVQELATIIE